MDWSSSCGPQPKAQPPPPAAHAPNPTRVISMSVVPSCRTGSVLTMGRLLSLAGAKEVTLPYLCPWARHSRGTWFRISGVIETQSMPQTGIWPRLALDEWAPTQTTLHRWTQMVGKTRLALAPMQNHWWQVVLYVTDRGLTTSPIPYVGRTFDVNFDFNDHVLIARTSDGDSDVMELPGLSVGDFYSRYMTSESPSLVR